MRLGHEVQALLRGSLTPRQRRLPSALTLFEGVPSLVIGARRFAPRNCKWKPEATNRRGHIQAITMDADRAP